MKDNVNKQKANEIIHVGFEIGIILKGIHGLLEVVGGVFLLFLTPNGLSQLTHFFTKHELMEDPRDRVANILLNLSGSFSISTQHFAEVYLISHGVIKCILIFLLLKRKLWAYPLTIIVLVLFIAYQIYRYTLTQSIFLILLSIFDTIMIALTYLEYKRIRNKL